MKQTVVINERNLITAAHTLFEFFRFLPHCARHAFD
jgi:hypothetical protein